jgi:hypothetical protein
MLRQKWKKGGEHILAGRTELDEGYLSTKVPIGERGKLLDKLHNMFQFIKYEFSNNYFDVICVISNFKVPNIRNWKVPF